MNSTLGAEEKVSLCATDVGWQDMVKISQEPWFPPPLGLSPWMTDVGGGRIW